MRIYSNGNNGDSLFGGGGGGTYKSQHDPEYSVNRKRAVKRDTQQQQKQPHKKQIRTKKLTLKNIKFLRSLGLQVGE